MIEVLRQDLKFALRSMRRGPMVALLAVTTLGMGVGASTAMFSVVDGVLLKPLPYPEAERVMLVWAAIEEWEGDPSLHSIWNSTRMSHPEYLHWAEHQQSFEAVAVFNSANVRIPAAQGATEIVSLRGTPELFTILGVAPVLGRVFDASDDEPVLLLSYELWQARYGGDSGVVGSMLDVHDVPTRIVGVMPAGFRIVGVDSDVWQPLMESPANMAAINNHSLLGLGRLRAGVSVAQAEQETGRLLRQAAEGAPRHNVTHGARLASPLAEATEAIRTPLLILTAASLVLLAAACANVALLLLGAGADRVRELSVRGALGAHRARLALQLMIESLTLSAAGALAGLLLAVAFARLLLLMAPPGTPRLEGVGIDLRAFAFAAVAAALCGVVAGCFPALSLSRVQAAESLRAGATATGRGGVQRVIVVAELALATVLLVGAGLLTRTLGELERVDPGFDAEGVITMALALPYDRLRQTGESPDAFTTRLQAYVATLTDEIRTIPGIDDVALTSTMPFSSDRGTTTIQVEGHLPAEGEEDQVAWRFVSGNYFELMRIAPVEGRTLLPADDRPGAERVTVVTDRFARHHWLDGRWLGRTIGFWGETYRVVGVVADTREQDLRGDADRFKFYVAGSSSGNLGGRYLIRSALPLSLLAPMLRQRVARADRSLVIQEMQSMEARVAASIEDYRYRMRLMQAFALTAALFCLLGVYGVMSRGVARRRQELGLRVALGAKPADIARQILREGLLIGALGAGGGVLVALVGTRALESMLWGVPATDPITFTAIAAGLLLLALLATLSPAFRAASVDPMRTLRGS